MNTPFRVLLLENVHPVAAERLGQLGFDVRVVDGSLSEAELIEALRGVQALGIRSKTQVTRAVLEAADSLIAVGAFCIGTNQIDLSAARERGITVYNAPFSNTRSVAEMVLAQVVFLARQLGDRSMEMHQGKWRKVTSNSREVRGKTLGVVGYGHIGRQVGVMAETFGMRVAFFDIQTQLPMGNNEPRPELEDLLGRSDFVTLHVPGTPQTHRMIGERELARMKKGACLINASRGTVVDIPALAAALRSGHIGGAAVDVFPEEPKKNVSDGFVTELQNLPNVILTPHIGGTTLEAQENIGREVSASLLQHLKTGSSVGSVTMPHVELPISTGAHRLVHVHQNVPGVLRDLNRIVSDSEANIQAQVLGTRENVGYLIMDLDRRADSLVEAIRQLPTTIRVRSLY